MLQIDTVAAFKCVFLIVTLQAWFKIKQAYHISSNQTNADEPVLSKRVLACRLIVWHLLSVKFDADDKLLTTSNL